jgi:hypothetical protein
MSTFRKRMEEAAKASQPMPRRVNLSEGSDFACVLLGSLGFSSRYISEHTAFSTGQISYRLRLGGVKRSDYRNGTAPMVGTIIRRAREVAIPEMQEHIGRVLREKALEKAHAQGTGMI